MRVKIPINFVGGTCGLVAAFIVSGLSIHQMVNADFPINPITLHALPIGVWVLVSLLVSWIFKGEWVASGTLEVLAASIAYVGIVVVNLALIPRFHNATNPSLFSVEPYPPDIALGLWIVLNIARNYISVHQTN